MTYVVCKFCQRKLYTYSTIAGAHMWFCAHCSVATMTSPLQYAVSWGSTGIVRGEEAHDRAEQR